MSLLYTYMVARRLPPRTYLGGEVVLRVERACRVAQGGQPGGQRAADGVRGVGRLLPAAARCSSRSRRAAQRRQLVVRQLQVQLRLEQGLADGAVEGARVRETRGRRTAAAERAAAPAARRSGHHAAEHAVEGGGRAGHAASRRAAASAAAAAAAARRAATHTFNVPHQHNQFLLLHYMDHSM